MSNKRGPLKIVITGGPAVGKTATIKELAKKYPVETESARYLFMHDKRFKGKTSETIDESAFQAAVFMLEVKHFKEASRERAKIVFFDRGFIDGFAYSKLNRVKFHKRWIEEANSHRYDYIFVLNPLPFYKTDAQRKESKSEARKIHNEIIKQYRKFGYKPILVPFDTIKNRAKFILKQIK